MAGASPSAGDKMDRIYRHQRFIYDLTRRYYLLGRDHLIDDLAVPDGGTVLEIGCGTGRNLLASARRYPSARHFGLDVSSAMLGTARKNIEGAALTGRVLLAQADATAFEPRAVFGVEAFDRIFCSYVISMIPPWADVVENNIRHLSPAGALHIVDFGDFARCPPGFGATIRAWLHRFHVHPISGLRPGLEEAARRHGLDFRFTSPFRGYAAYATLARSGSCGTVVDACLNHQPCHRPVMSV
jgi:S-adenosylmethionine-diacylgycerolhomoserine-N-methlytransferase